MIEEKEQEVEQEQQEEERRVYKIIHGNFNYGGKNKTYGLFFVALDESEVEIKKLDFAIANNKQLMDIDLKISTKIFVEALTEAKEQEVYKSQKLAMNLKSSLTDDDLSEIFRALDADNLEGISEIFKENIENLFQEQVQLKIDYTTLTEEELGRIYPDLFAEESATEDDEGVEISDDAVADKPEAKKEKADLNLKCSPVISPTRGKKAEKLNVGDEVSVKITDTSDTAKRLRSKLYGDKNFANGKIDELLYNQESNRYAVKIHFADNIYGELKIGPQVKLAIADTETIAEEDESVKAVSNSSKAVDKKLIFLFAVAGVAIIILILLIALF